jgi:hypothetical protein
MSWTFWPSLLLNLLLADRMRRIITTINLWTSYIYFDDGDLKYIIIISIIINFQKKLNFENLSIIRATHGGCDRRLVMVERVLVAMKKMRHMFFLCVRYLATCISSLGKRG